VLRGPLDPTSRGWS